MGLFLLSITMSFFLSCQSKRFISHNISSNYDKRKSQHLYFSRVFHESNDSSKVFLKIPKKEFDLLKADPTYNLKISIFLYASHSQSEAYYNNVIVQNFNPNSILNEYLETELYFPLIKNKKAILYIIINDLNNVEKPKWEKKIELDKTTNFNRQYFLIRDKNDQVIYNNFVSDLDSFYIELSSEIVTKKLIIKQFKPFNEVARAPYLGDDLKRKKLKSDTTFIIELNKSKTELINLPSQGVYHFLAETSNREGLTLFNFYNNFPKIDTHDKMFYPLKYITANKEFKQIVNSIDKISSIENFWTFISSNKESAKERIKEYYSRVYFSNIFFSSHLEGWQTDRGMVYIVMGPPHIVYRQAYREIWIYGDEKHFGSISFDFIQVLNPLSENDYILKRNPSYKEVWTSAIDMWRR